MKYFSYLILTFVFLISCNPSEDGKPHVLKDFLRYYQANVLAETDTLVIAKDAIESREYDEIWNTLMIDSLIAKQFSVLSIKEWDSTYFNKARFLSSDELMQIRYDLNIQKKFYTDYKGFFTLSQPYISKNGDYILIKMYYICGDRCGHGSIQLFKAHQKTWVLVKKYSEGIS